MYNIDDQWGETVHTACKLYSLNPHSVLDTGVAPFQAWHGFKPNTLHSFGSDVSVVTPTHECQKGAHAKHGKFDEESCIQMKNLTLKP